MPREGERVRAHVVRVESVDMSSPLPWRYLAAAQFDEPHPVLEPVFAEAEALS
jgi:hypothetical protein